MDESAAKRFKAAKRVTLLGVMVNGLLGLLKVFFGAVGHSQALLADGVHSFSDLLTDIMVLFAAKAGSHGPDHDHPYGHARIETLAAMALALVLVLVGVGIMYEAIMSLINHPQELVPSNMVVAMAVVSIMANEALYRITLSVGNKINSALLRTNAWHNRVDALSSLVVLVGVVGAKLGYIFLDRAAAIIVGIFIIKIGVQMAWTSIKELVDTGVSEDQRKEILQGIRHVPGVKAVHQLRTRSLAGAVFTDVHIQVNARITVSEGHYIADQVCLYLIQAGMSISDVLVHVDAEDDEEGAKAYLLPNRSVIENALSRHWEKLPGNEQRRINLHYLANKVEVEVFLPITVLSAENTATSLAQQYRAVMKKIDYIGRVQLHFSDVFSGN